MDKVKKALVVWGGWEGHEPEQVANRFANTLRQHGFAVTVTNTLESLNDLDALKALDLMVFQWTMGEITKEQVFNVSEAVGSGVGLVGCHGGLCDAFRNSVQWQFMTGGNWVSHPGSDGVEYTVNICHGSSPLVEGVEDFTVCSEHYYLHVDPAVEVLATTRFPSPEVPYYHSANKVIDMPVAWTKFWGLGRVYYCSLGHKDNIFDLFPSAEELMNRGMLWAANGKKFAQQNGLTVDRFLNEEKMY